MQVPGPDGGFGFGGHCFPKDVSALIYYAKGQKVKLDLLSKSLKVNDTLRTKS
jgi:UDP-glucose 6-dehydrogenase